MNLVGLTEEQIKLAVHNATKEHEASLWGQKSTIKPCLIEGIHGDGLQLVYLEPIDTRPNYYVLRIDSAIDVKNDESMSNEDQSEYGTVWEMLLRMIEEEYPNIDSFKENKDGTYTHCSDEDDVITGEFPCLSWSGGSWGQLKIEL